MRTLQSLRNRQMDRRIVFSNWSCSRFVNKYRNDKKVCFSSLFFVMIPHWMTQKLCVYTVETLRTTISNKQSLKVTWYEDILTSTRSFRRLGERFAVGMLRRWLLKISAEVIAGRFRRVCSFTQLCTNSHAKWFLRNQFLYDNRKPENLRSILSIWLLFTMTALKQW